MQLLHVPPLPALLLAFLIRSKSLCAAFTTSSYTILADTTGIGTSIGTSIISTSYTHSKVIGLGRPRSHSHAAQLSSSSSSSSNNNDNNDNEIKKIEKSNEEWRNILSPEAYRVLREDGTEPPNSSPLNNIKQNEDEGTFICAGCNSPLFTANTKFESGSGWPSFYTPIDNDSVDLLVDFKLVLPRTEVRCKSCGGHLGHVFDDGPKPTGKRYCMNGIAMQFIPSKQEDYLEVTKKVEKRVQAAQAEGISNIVQQPIITVLSSIVIDGSIGALFISSFVKQHHGNNNGGVINGVDQLMIDLEKGGILNEIFQFLPLVIGAFYVASALKRVVDIAGLD